MDKMRLVCLFAGLFLMGSDFFPVSAHAVAGASPSSLNFGSVTVNTTSQADTIVVTNLTAQTLVIDNVTSNLPEFLVGGHTFPLTLGPHGSTTVQVTFRPNTATAFSGSIAVTAGTRYPKTIYVAVSGTGTPVTGPPPQTFLLTPGASALSFANQLVGTAASQAISLKNTGTGSVTVSQVAASGAGFSVSGFSSAVTLAAGQSLALSANFAPSAAGNASGSITVISSATNSPATISLSGTGVQPLISLIPSSVSFGNVTVGVTNTQTITIKNPGTANLSVTQASLAGTGYSLSGLALPLSISPNGSAAFNVGFAPVSAGNLSGSLTLVSNAPSSPSSIALSGAGIAAVLQLSANPAALSFGSHTTGTSATLNLTLTNTGNSSVSISQIAASGAGFSKAGVVLPISLAAGQSTSVSAAFAPASVGTLAGSITVVSNAANSPLVVPLSGTGTAPASYTVTLGWTPSSSSYTGFNIYRGTTSGGPYTRVDTSMVSSTTYTDGSVVSGQTYYYVATEVDTTGAESGYSGEVSATIP